MEDGPASIGSVAETLTCLTFLGDDDAQQRTGRGDSFVKVVIVVDWEEVSVDVSVAQLHLCSWNAVDGLEEGVELQEASRAVSLQTKAAIFCLKLVRKTGESSQCSGPAASEDAGLQHRLQGLCWTWRPGQNFNSNMEERERE